MSNEPIRPIKHVDKLFPAKDLIEILNEQPDVSVSASEDGNATIMDMSNSRIVIRKSNSTGTAIDLYPKS